MKAEVNLINSFEAGLAKYCYEGKTGTLLIATNSNKSCQITIEAGEIIAVSMGRLKGYDATNELISGGIKRSAFTEYMKFPHTKEAFIGSSDKFLKLMNIDTKMPLAANNTENEKQAAAA